LHIERSPNEKLCLFGGEYRAIFNNFDGTTGLLNIVKTDCGDFTTI
jgi:hypothetical protein